MFRYLYYPTIKLPDDIWLRTVLLYSDKVASIVPSEMQDTFKETYKYLIEKNELEMLTPEIILKNIDIESFKDNLVAEFDYILKQGNDDFDQQDKIKIHRTKIPSMISENLKDVKALSDFDQSWSLMDRDLGTIYMAVLAKYAAKEFNYIPATNSSKYQNMLFKEKPALTTRDTNNIDTNTYNGIGELLVLNSLPTPTGENSIEKIIEFKKSREIDLFQFRTVIRDFIRKINEVESESQIYDYIQEFEEKIIIETRNMKKLLKENKINFILKSFKSLINMKTHTALALLTSKLGIDPFLGSSISASIGIGDVFFSSNKKKNEIQSTPYSYVFSSKQELKMNDRHYEEMLQNKLDDKLEK